MYLNQKKISNLMDKKKRNNKNNKLIQLNEK